MTKHCKELKEINDFLAEFYLFIILLLSVRGLRCCPGFPLVLESRATLPRRGSDISAVASPLRSAGPGAWLRQRRHRLNPCGARA